MALHINNEEADRLAEELVTLTGESKTTAIIQSMKDRLEKLRPRQPNQNQVEDLRRIAAHFNALPVYDARTPEEILGYDENGLPR